MNRRKRSRLVAQKGWEVKVTFDVGPKLKGKRIRERLKTRDLAEAIARKDNLTAN